MRAATSPRLGYCCKFLPPDRDPALTKRMNMASTTITALSRLSDVQAIEKLVLLARHNMTALKLQLSDVAARPPLQRLLRIISSILPAFNHPLGRHYREPELRSIIETGLAEAGALARAAGIRISMHPDQFCVLNARTGAQLANSLGELEYHAQVLGMMGLSGGWHPNGTSINIHGGSRAAGLALFREGLARLSADARSLLTVENDEVSYGLDDLLPIADEVPIVIDFHHHWIMSQGEYIEPDDPRLDIVRASWRGVRPLSHISVSREALLGDHDPDVLPNFAALIACGISARDLRGHSDLMWNRAVNAFVGRHLTWTDIEVEAKSKNLASEQMAAQLADPIST
ncbi:UV damage endonuclease UvsE [Flaviflagellibacter deserti]|uniref:UV damage endonuclease UvsE n=1 Tax=Flaviflagellibacter deserti TaxID=2267266 RepID=A0ABV9Z1W0_9HYPH